MVFSQAMEAVGKALRRHVEGPWDHVRSNNLWKRMLRVVMATTIVGMYHLQRFQILWLIFAIAVIVGLIHEPNSHFGKAAYVSAMISIFAHPGRRFGQLVEQLSLAILGGLLGAALCILGVYLGSLLVHRNETAAYAVRAIFLLVVLLFHGFLRSHTPRLWTFILLLVIVFVTGITTTSSHVNYSFAAQLLYPILLAAAVILVVNVCIFPEFSSTFLGKTTMDTLTEATKALTSAGQYFVEADVQTISTPMVKAISLSDLTAAKTKLRSKMASCLTLQSECQFEVAFAVLPPRYLSIINNQALKKQVASTVAVVGACESRYALLGETRIKKEMSHHTKKDILHNGPSHDETEGAIGTSRTLNGGLLDLDGPLKYDLDLMKPQREIERGDIELLRHLLEIIRQPYMDLQRKYLQMVEIVNSCLAFAYVVYPIRCRRFPVRS